MDGKVYLVILSEGDKTEEGMHLTRANRVLQVNGIVDR